MSRGFSIGDKVQCISSGVIGYYVQPNYWVLPKVFQFPEEEEVEV